MIAKLGAGGWFSQGLEPVRVPGSPTKDVVDPVGAGDVFVAGFIAARLERRDEATSLRWGKACGALGIGDRIGPVVRPRFSPARRRAGAAPPLYAPQMPPDVVSIRALNRTLLRRQLLLEPSTMGVMESVRHLVGLQAQVPTNPYVGLRARLAGFEPATLEALVEAGDAVRIVAMRATIHLLVRRFGAA